MEPIFLVEDDEYLQRELRGGKGGGGGGGGGSYGGGGGGYHGYGGTYGNGHHNSRNSTHYGGGMELNPLWGIFVAVAVAICVVCYCCAKSSSSSSSDNKAMSEEEFEEVVRDQKEQVRQHSRGVSKGANVPKSGLYQMSYEDRGTTYGGTVQLDFHNVGDGYEITGEVKDADGKSIIQEGFVAYDGKAYWKDKCVESSSGDVGMSVISVGDFNFEDSTFQGTWNAITGIGGLYTSFNLITESPDKDESTVTEPEEEDIFVQNTPVVPQAPVWDDVHNGEKKDDSPPPSTSNQNNQAGGSLFDQMQSGLRGFRG